HKALGVAVVATHHAVAAVAAHVQQRVEPALPVASQDDRVFAHVGVEEIVDHGHQALVPDHQPGAPEDLLHLVVVDRLLAEDAAIEFAARGVDDDVLPSGAHTPILPLAIMISGAEADHHRVCACDDLRPVECRRSGAAAGAAATSGCTIFFGSTRR